MIRREKVTLRKERKFIFDMDVILHLGGNSQRAQTAIELANAFPDAKIVISSETPCTGVYTNAGIDRERIIVNDEAWDTVTNLTHTYKELKRLHCKRVFVVTDMFHTYRSSLITAAVWGGRIPFYMVPHGFSINVKDEKYSMGQFFVTLLWRLTGILVYSKRLKEQRKSIYTETEKHSLFELGY